MISRCVMHYNQRTKVLSSINQGSWSPPSILDSVSVFVVTNGKLGDPSRIRPGPTLQQLESGRNILFLLNSRLDVFICFAGCLSPRLSDPMPHCFSVIKNLNTFSFTRGCKGCLLLFVTCTACLDGTQNKVRRFLTALGSHCKVNIEIFSN